MKSRIMHCCTEAWNQAIEILTAHMIDRLKIPPASYNEGEALQTILLLFRFKAKESLQIHNGLDHPHHFKPLKKYMPNS